MLDGLTPNATFACGLLRREVLVASTRRRRGVLPALRTARSVGAFSRGTPGRGATLASFDEYQLMKYANAKADWRLCDVIAILRDELSALGATGELALNVRGVPACVVA
ncbi:MAG: hypothetical protein R3E66_12450 [bacterium]